MADCSAKPIISPERDWAAALYALALQLGPLRDAAEVGRVILEGSVALTNATAGLLLAPDLPPVALGGPAPTPDEARALLASEALRAAFEAEFSVLPAGVVPLPGAMLLAAAISAESGPRSLLLLAHAEGPFGSTAQATLAQALPLFSQSLVRARYHEQLRALETARSQAVSRLAHDIRSPLVATHASLEVVQRLLRGREVPANAFAALATGLRSVQSAVELCNDLLEVTRLQHGYLPAMRAVPLTRLLADTCEMLSHVAAGRGVHLDAPAPAAGLSAAGDERLLRRMLVNLVTNGLRFAPEGGFVTVEGLAGETVDTVLLRVSDNGPGVAPEERERIFVPFAQGQGEAGRGVGLGLALCREVALVHGGAIWAEERAGGGVRFVVCLPAG